MNSPLISTESALTVAEVAAREKVSERMVRYWCKTGALFTAAKVGEMWLIHPDYFVKIERRHIPPAPPEARLPGRGRGRPAGVKNSRPYPEGVKRPRRKR